MKKWLLIFCFIICVEKFVLTSNCPFGPKCDCNQTTLICANFTNFAELDFSLAGNASAAYKFTKIVISPLQNQELYENALNFGQLVIDTNHGATVELYNVNAFYFNANPLATLTNIYKRHTITLKLIDSQFKFKYSQSTDLNSLCGLESFATNQNPNRESMFTMANFIHLHRVKFVEPVCPFIFMNVRLAQVHISSPIMINGARNAFEFLSVKLDKRPIKLPWGNFKKDNETSQLNSVVHSLVVENTRFDQLDETNMPELVFYNLRFLRLVNVELNAVNDRLFYNFKYVNKLDVNLNNWKTFLYKNDSLGFVKGLNAQVAPVNLDANTTKSSDLKQRLYVYLDGRGAANETSYQFSDSDFCLFVNFPIDRLIVPYVFTNDLKCSCTIKWLNRYMDKFPFDFYYGASTSALCIDVSCDFNQLKSTCKNLKPDTVDWNDAGQNGDNTSTGQKPAGLSKGIIALIVILCVLAVVALVAIVLVRNYLKARRLRREQTIEMGSFATMSSSATSNQEHVFVKF